MKIKKAITILIASSFLYSSLILFSIIGTSDEPNATTLYVGGNGDGNYSSIQDAIDNASSKDTVYVFIGNYFENIKVNKSITLFGEDKNITILEGNVIISSDGVNINGFTINNSNIKGVQKDYGIEIKSNNSIITNNIISNNNIGVYILGFNNNLLYHNNFINNTQNAYDEGNNTWFNSELNQGNYWDNYTGLDINNDGIGDEPYEIPGGDNVDEYPLMIPYDGTIRIKEFYIDDDLLYNMLIVGMIVAVLFCLPIAYVWYRKYYKVK